MQNSETQKPTIFRSASEAIMYFGQKYLSHNGERAEINFNLNDPQRRLAYQKAYLSFAGGTDCSRFNIKPHKGILMVGDKGVGKTTLMAVMQRMFKDTPRRFRRVTGLEIKKMIETATTEEILQMYGKEFKCDLFIEDIGLGQTSINKFGNWVNIISELLYERYELYTEDRFKTHITSNKSTDEIEEMYGDLVLDRIIEMNNLITWEGDSLRKP